MSWAGSISAHTLSTRWPSGLSASRAAAPRNPSGASTPPSVRTKTAEWVSSRCWWTVASSWLDIVTVSSPEDSRRATVRSWESRRRADS